MANSHRSDSVTGSSSNRHALVDEVRPTLLGIWFATDSALEGRVTSESGNPDFGSSRWHFAVNGLAGDEADGSSHAVKVFTELTVVEGHKRRENQIHSTRVRDLGATNCHLGGLPWIAGATSK